MVSCFNSLKVYYNFSSDCKGIFPVEWARLRSPIGEMLCSAPVIRRHGNRVAQLGCGGWVRRCGCCASNRAIPGMPQVCSWALLPSSNSISQNHLRQIARIGSSAFEDSLRLQLHFCDRPNLLRGESSFLEHHQRSSTSIKNASP